MPVSKWYVVVDGPFPNCDHEEEYPEWVVQVVHDDGNEENPSNFRSYESAMACGKELATKRRIELVVEAIPL